MKTQHFSLTILLIFGYLFLIAEYILLYGYPEYVALIPLILLKPIIATSQTLRLLLPFLAILTSMHRSLSRKLHQATQQAVSSKKAAPSKRLVCLSLAGIGSYYVVLFEIIPLPQNIWLIAYPLSLVVSAISASLLGKALPIHSKSMIKNPKRKLRSKWGFHLRLTQGWLNLPNPFRGILVIGSAGSGKSYSIAEPLIQQAASKGYTGIIYDFKFPTLSHIAYTAYQYDSKDIKLYVLNFTDLTRSHRLNPLKPENIPVMAYAESYAEAMISNLIPESIQHKDFWIRSSTAVLTATIWYLKKHHSTLCSLPHAVALICHPKFEHFVAKLAQDPECQGLIASLATAIDREADKQIAGVLGSLQIALAILNNPEIAWVMSGDDFDLQLNNPIDKKLLLIGNHPTLASTFAPVISCIMTVALKRMNQPLQRHSMVLLDEAPTLYIPGFEQIPATARSNKIATIFLAQDISQIVKSYGKVQAEVIIGNLNSQLYGRASNQRTAEYVSQMFGKETREIKNRNESVSRSLHHGVIPYHIPRKSHSVSYQQQELPVLKPQEVMDLEVGEFTGVTVGKRNEWFKGKVRPTKSRRSNQIPAFASGINVAQNFEQIQQEIISILT